MNFHLTLQLPDGTKIGADLHAANDDVMPLALRVAAEHPGAVIDDIELDAAA